MNDKELNQKIRNEVFSEHGIRLSEQDPIFSVVLANKMMLDSVSDSLEEVVRDVPRAMNTVIEKIVLAVEDSERTVGSLRDETKGMLSALTKLEIENAHQRIKEIVVADTSAVLTGSTQALQSVAAKAEGKINELSASLRDTKLLITNVCLSVALALIVMTASIGGVMLYNFAQDSQESANYWYGESKKQSQAIDSLPNNVKKQVLELMSKKG
ncbi:hypothetical protein ALQ86_200219 [Pseudomonas amygdali pv. eriobotryae]|uniref:Uncharacterized protein n=1 Tax=Pseudomonas amygdali pv. eriobotryae TaxID=129137 RepID=A0A3M3A9A1_PSEA0|nr:hypothetical protein [Pseudomonas amygdali]RML97010.1 hypothetical protein ALQ86_200219 [Pseudomonas amygdali pv. eriobotryae]